MPCMQHGIGHLWPISMLLMVLAYPQGEALGLLMPSARFPLQFLPSSNRLKAPSAGLNS